MITFLSPLFLVAASVAVIPLIIHLSRARRIKKLRFSTTRFFTESFLRSYRMNRLKELVLLACRMAVCALLAAALARPLLLPRGDSFLSGGSRALVLVIDNSASMSMTEDGVSMFERVRAGARELLDSLRAGDSATIVLAGRRDTGPEVLFPEPTPEIGDVLQALQGLEVSALGADLNGAVARAESIALSSGAASKEVFVLSDLQDSGWELDEKNTAPAGTTDVLFFFVAVRPKNPSNTGITAVQYGAARPMVGVPFSILPHLASFGPRGKSVDLRLYLDGQKVGERTADRLSDGRCVAPRFVHTFTTGGWHSGHVEVSDEGGFPLDDRRYFAFEVLDALRVLTVNGAPSQVTRLDELFFLKAALTAGPEGQGPVQVDEIVPADLARSDLSRYPLIVLANVESLAGTAESAPGPDGKGQGEKQTIVEKLEGYVENGGSLWIFLGDKVNATFYNEQLFSPTRLHGGLLPGKLVEVIGNPAGNEEQNFVAEVAYEHPALAPFAEPRFGNLGAVRLKAFWKIEPGPAAVLMRGNGGAPLLLEKTFGKGRVMLFASSCDRDWNNFPVRPAYLPWVHRIAGYLAQQTGGQQAFFRTGDAVPLPVAVSEALPQIRVKRPDGTISPARATGDAEQPLVFDAMQPGIYTVLSGDKAGANRLFAVNVERYESELVYLDDVLADQEGGSDRNAAVEAGLKKLLPGRPLIAYVSDPSQLRDVALSASRGIKLWDMVLMIVLVGALFEPWLANQICLRHYTSAK